MEEKCKRCYGAGGECQEMTETCAADTDNGCEQCGCCGTGQAQNGGGGCGGCAGGCPHAAKGELVWDYDDTVLVFSSDMLEEAE